MLREDLLKSIFPIIQLDERTERYDIAGSAVLVEYNNLKFLITAGHVLKRNGEKYPLFIFLDNENIRLNGPAFVKDDIDIAVFDLRTDKNLNKYLKIFIPLELKHKSSNTTNNINYLVYGFPYRRSHFDKKTSNFSINPIIYLTKESEKDIYSKFSIDSNNFRIVDYNQKKSKNENGIKTIVSIPHGASGGGLIKVYSNEERELVSFEFDGTLIEWKSKKYIVSTRSRAIIATIEEVLNS